MLVLLPKVNDNLTKVSILAQAQLGCLAIDDVKCPGLGREAARIMQGQNSIWHVVWSEKSFIVFDPAVKIFLKPKLQVINSTNKKFFLAKTNMTTNFPQHKTVFFWQALIH